MPTAISGATKVLGILGDPIVQVRAPLVWTGLFERNGIDAVCIPMHVAPPHLAQFLQGAKALKNFVGFIVTVPHKPAALLDIAAPTERARRVGGVNVIRVEGEDWTGDILDGVGFVDGLHARGHDVAGRRALIVGSGGVGTAIAFALAEAGAKEIAVADVVSERAQNLAQRISSTGVAARIAPADAAGFDLVVNATPMGMRPDDALPIDLDRVSRGTIVADAVMKPPVTALLRAAAERGCVVQPGALMMDYQIAAMARFFGFTGGNWSPELIAQFAGDG